jgi:hypothetical protein
MCIEIDTIAEFAKTHTKRQCLNILKKLNSGKEIKLHAIEAPYNSYLCSDIKLIKRIENEPS